MQRLPLRPEFHNGVLPSLQFVRTAAPGERLVMRLWSTLYSVDETGTGAAPVPLWIGSIEQQALHRFGGLASWAETVEGPPPVDRLRQTLDGPGSALRIEPVPDHTRLLLH